MLDQKWLLLALVVLAIMGCFAPDHANVEMLKGLFYAGLALLIPGQMFKGPPEKPLEARPPIESPNRATASALKDPQVLAHDLAAQVQEQNREIDATDAGGKPPGAPA